ncbi:MAG: hypothetical protein JXA42_05105 [Anaerolineales bacterium]|nr:hypothetical protein [Anaerolineales bacterium]
MLARTLEKAGFSTVMVTNMPFWAEKIGVPRTLAVEFPFGHTLGQPHDSEQQMRVIGQALAPLESAKKPGTIVHSTETWPVPAEQAIKDWQPAEPSPVVRVMGSQIRQLLRGRKKRAE